MKIIYESTHYVFTRDNGETVTLTNKELDFIREHLHKADVLAEVENAVKCAEDNGDVSFASFADCYFAHYSSEEDARADLIEYVADSIIEEDNLYERNPDPFIKDYEEVVLETAEDLGFRVEQ